MNAELDPLHEEFTSIHRETSTTTPEGKAVRQKMSELGGSSCKLSVQELKDAKSIELELLNEELQIEKDKHTAQLAQLSDDYELKKATIKLKKLKSVAMFDYCIIRRKCGPANQACKLVKKLREEYVSGFDSELENEEEDNDDDGDEMVTTSRVDACNKARIEHDILMLQSKYNASLKREREAQILVDRRKSNRI